MKNYDRTKGYEKKVGGGNLARPVHSGSSQHTPIFEDKNTSFLFVWGGCLSCEDPVISFKGGRESSESFPAII